MFNLTNLNPFCSSICSLLRSGLCSLHPILRWKRLRQGSPGVVHCPPDGSPGRTNDRLPGAEELRSSGVRAAHLVASVGRLLCLHRLRHRFQPDQHGDRSADGGAGWGDYPASAPRPGSVLSLRFGVVSMLAGIRNLLELQERSRDRKLVEKKSSLNDLVQN